MIDAAPWITKTSRIIGEFRASHRRRVGKKRFSRSVQWACEAKVEKNRSEKLFFLGHLYFPIVPKKAFSLSGSFPVQ